MFVPDDCYERCSFSQSYLEDEVTLKCLSQFTFGNISLMLVNP